MRTLWLALVLAGCSSVRPTALDPGAEMRGHELALRAARAHGGLAKWTTLGGVRLRVRASGMFSSGLFYPVDAEYLLDPAGNKALVRFVTRRGREEWRFDGHDASATVDGMCRGSTITRKKVAGILATFLFWFGVPFKFLDEGAHPQEYRGQLYVTYKDVGQTPDDWYLVRFDARGRVQSLVYVASALSKKLEFRGRWMGYRNWDGLEVPQRLDFAPRSRVLRGLAPAGELALSDVHMHLDLHDVDFHPVKCD
jgi:hypothetical protein